MTPGKRAVVIGAGPAGLKAAHVLAKAGLEVTLLEHSDRLGGLASSIDLDGVRIERYYHFICKGDDDLVSTLDELGLSRRLHWKSSRMAYFVDGRLLPFLTPLELLRFTPLSLTDRLRAGVAVKLAQRMKEEDLAEERAIPWLTKMFGEKAYRVIWEPLLRFKFAEHAEAISAAWIWARMVRLSRSRTSPWKEELGYVEGGSQMVLEALGDDLRRRSHRVSLNAPVEGIVIEDGVVRGVRTTSETLPADVVVSTVTTSRFRKLTDGHLPTAFDAALAKIPTIGIFCLFLRLTRQVTPFFWVNTNDSRVPFAGMIEYTNLNPVPQLGGDHILYVPQYLSADDPRYAQSDEDVLRRYADALALVNPAFDRSWIRYATVFRDRYAQPICLTDYKETTPPFRTPVRGLYLTDSCQLHPHDRSISGSFGLGRQAAEAALADLRAGGDA
jgi:protoporphyrinogen oxidase